MEATLTYKCPNCDAGLIFDAEKQAFVCEFCISSFTEEELSGTDAAQRAERAEREDAEFNSEIDGYYCPSCGAEVIADKNTVSDTCYYCHNPVVLSDKVSGELKPAKIIPFAFDKEGAQAEFHKFAKKKWFIPRDYFATAQMEKIAGVYFPFWITDADTEADMLAVGKRVRSWRQGDYRYTETTIYDVTRAGRIHYEDISTSAISTEDREMLEGVLPYPTDAYKDFSMPYLQGFVAKKRDLNREQLSEVVRKKMDGYAEEILSGTARNYTHLSVKNLNQSVLCSHWLYSLLPVWVLTYKKQGKTKERDRVFHYAMNGNTGKLYGELPVSIPRLLLACIGVFAAVFGLAFLFAAYGFEDMGIGVLWASIFAIVGGAATGIGIVRKYKKKLQAPSYPLEHYANLSLHRSDDRFVDRIVTRVRVQSNNKKK